MSHESRFWTILTLVITVIGVWFAYKQLEQAQRQPVAETLPLPAVATDAATERNTDAVRPAGEPERSTTRPPTEATAVPAPAPSSKDVATDAPPAQIAQKPAAPLPPPIGLKNLVCDTRSIELTLPAEQLGTGYSRQLRVISGTHSISVVYCDAITGAFTVAANNGLDREPTPGSAKDYSLSFTYIAATRNGNENTDTTCRVGAQRITARAFSGTATCQYEYKTAVVDVEISL
ncbi:MAG: hypothetical protein EON59_10550 [Alphaproteobacteria bacterium]|nr:MAG: hypothetical protein EON59_10550 [Alphaproteobacteria bacterium]